MQDTEYLRDMLSSENEQLEKLNAIVREAMQEEELLTAKIASMDDQEKPSWGERLSDKVASFGGSWTFIIVFMFILIVWIILNSFALKSKAFDPYPYILMNLILSCIAALQAPIIMMSQNRKEAKDRKRAENDYLINLKAEIEIRNLHKKIDLQMIDQFKHLCDIQQKQIEMLEKIQKN